MSAIPVYVVEEHHEAFCVWRRASAEGVIPARGNTLLHVDEHSDMTLPRLRRPLSSISGSEDLVRFTYDELDIGNFIWPAVYLGTFSRVCWMRLRHKPGASWQNMKICGKNRAATEFITGSSLAGTPYENAPDIVPMEFSQITTADSLRTDQPVVLDIDLDYFYCNDFPDYRDQEIEIAAEAYRAFVSDRYHFLRIAPGSDVSAEDRGGRFFLRFNQYPRQRAAMPEETIRATIQERIGALVRYLADAGVTPPLVTICRSVHSGYTPREHAAFMESQTLAALDGAFGIRNVPIEELGLGRWDMGPTVQAIPGGTG